MPAGTTGKIVARATANRSTSERGTPEAIVKQAVDELKAKGEQVAEATVHHWPGSGSDVVDTLLTNIRKGNF